MDPETIKLLAMITGLVALLSFFMLIFIGLEGYERNDEFLREYGMKLKVYATLVKVLFIYPKIAKFKEGLLGLKEEAKQEKKT